MVATRRSTRSQGRATPAADPVPPPPPAPTPKRQTRGKAKVVLPASAESPAKTPAGTKDNDEVVAQDVTPSKRKHTPATKRASPSTRKKTTPVKQVETPSKESETDPHKATTARSIAISSDDADVETKPAINNEVVVTTTPSKEVPSKKKASPAAKQTPKAKAGNGAADASATATPPIAQQKSKSTEVIPSDTESEGDDEDVEAMVNLALTAFTSPSNDEATPIQDAEVPVTKELVSNRLHSGVTTRDLYLKFNGNKCANGAQLASERKLVEELKQFAKTQKVQAVQDVANGKAHTTTTDAGKNQTSSKWFNMVSNELTAEAKRDIQLIKMRNYIDPKRFYKSSDHRKSAMPKVFQVGTVIEGAAEFKSARVSRKDRHQTFTEEILHDKKIGGYTKRKYGDIQAAKANPGKNKFKKAKHHANRK
ncbi:hypothetical protein DYB25_000710 [Aphanomyces astaci]|uniref:Fcf2 pre-rRNA processing C-terminal domain-containing protein n=2 Tax=Aphanomyces astaci TaxID=112090 RepID=A0A397B4D1_APHAT|nr:hypothetical protein DYB25_000710 [Aphanomyces astaci]